MCLLRGGVGVSAPGGVSALGVCLLRGAGGGVSAPGGVGLLWGGLLWGGCEVPPPPLLTESQTPVKT